jgi:acetoacetyl-CoA synthetase
MAVPDGARVLLWQPSEEIKQQSNLTRYMQWLNSEKGLSFQSRNDVWEWSVTELEAFWASIWEFFHVLASKPYSSVLAAHTMPGAQWFVGSELNYAEYLLSQGQDERPALLFQSEQHPLREIHWAELRQKVSSIAQFLRSLGVQRGDRVVGYLPNIPETIIAFLACASIGATWSVCSPDFGARSVIDRFQQIEPTVLFAVDGYQYNGKAIDRRPLLAELQQALPGLKTTVLIPYLFPEQGVADLPNTLQWDTILAEHTQEGDLTFEQVPFDHPLWILYTSGTTGAPKAIVQGHGGILLEQLKSFGLGSDIKEGDRFFQYTITGWMMWNVLVGTLLVGSTSILYDGSPSYPNQDVLWQLAETTRMTSFGTSAGYLISCMKAGIKPGHTHDLRHLRSLGATGSPLPPEGFQWVYEQVKSDIFLSSASGGTDVCTSFVGGSVIQPVYAGEIQARGLGIKVEAFDEQGHALIDEMGELVITEPMPSMPLFFWNDPDGRRYRESYFEVYPGIWRHGDWIKIQPDGSSIIYGRSDATLNRKGVRMGSSEIYRAVEDLPQVRESLVIGVERQKGKYYMPLFVVLQEDVVLDDALKNTISQRIRQQVSPNHVPDEIIAIQEVPHTLNGKKLEVPVKKLLLGMPVEKAVNIDSMSNPQAIEFFIAFAAQQA